MPPRNTVTAVTDAAGIQYEPVPFAGCWLWIGGLVRPNGYGVVSINGKMRRVHRLMWERYNGPIPPGIYVCHTCDTPSCVNPAHLFLGTHKDNMRDKAQKGLAGKVLTKHQVMEIKKLLHTVTIKEIASMYGVSRCSIGLIKSGEWWWGVKEARHE